MTVLKKTELLRVLKGGVSDEVVLAANGKTCPHCGKSVRGMPKLQYFYSGRSGTDWNGNPIIGSYAITLFTMKDGRRFYQTQCGYCSRHWWVHREINIVKLYCQVIASPYPGPFEIGREMLTKDDVAPAKEIRVLRPADRPIQIAPVSYEKDYSNVSRLNRLMEYFG